MGSAASTSSSSGMNKQQRHQMEADRANLTRGVERFVINVYASFPRSESMRIILSSHLAMDAFAQFLKQEHAEEVFNLYQEATQLRNLHGKANELARRFNTLVVKYVRPDTDSQVMVSFALQEACIAALSAEPSDNGYEEKIFQLCGELQEEGIMLLARDQFNRFLLSKHYKIWRATESSHAMATTADDAKNSNPKPNNNNHQSTSGNNRPLSPTKAKRATDLSVRAFANIDTNELGKLLGAENWLAALLAAVEGLPLSFCLATARKDRRGFPLMYVNKYFEKITGFSRSDVLGKNCKFLQSDNADKAVIQSMSEALRNAKPITVVLKNKTSKGVEFTNLCSMKPIMDDKGTYCYVIAIQVDVSREQNDFSSKIQLAQDLMDMIPNVMFTDDDDEPPKAGCFPASH